MAFILEEKPTTEGSFILEDKPRFIIEEIPKPPTKTDTMFTQATQEIKDRIGPLEAVPALLSELMGTAVGGVASLANVIPFTPPGQPLQSPEERPKVGLEAMQETQEQVAGAISKPFEPRTEGGKWATEMAHKGLEAIPKVTGAITEFAIPDESQWLKRSVLDTLLQVVTFEAGARGVKKATGKAKGKAFTPPEEYARPKTLAQRLAEAPDVEGARKLTPAAEKMIRQAEEYPFGKPGLTKYTKEEKAYYKKTHAGQQPNVVKPIEFKEPGIASYTVTPMGYEMKRLGLEPILGMKQQATKDFSVAFNKHVAMHQEWVNDLYGIEGTSHSKRVRAKIKNVPPEEIQAMAEVVNKYQEPPEFLTYKEAQWFNRYREYTELSRENTNAVHRKVGLPEIPHKEAYFRHVANEVALDMLNGKYPFPEELKYWSKRFEKKKYYNPTEIQRTLGDELNSLFTKDIKKALDSMAYYNLKVQYLTEPQIHFKNMLKAYGKDMPATTRTWAREYNSYLDRNQTWLDELVNNYVTKTALKRHVNTILKPLGRTIGQKPVSRLSIGLGRYTMASVMGPRPKLIIRNLFQRSQTMSFMPSQQWLRAHIPADTKIIEMIKQGDVWKDYSAFEDIAAGGLKTAEKWWHSAYQRSAISNVMFSEKAAYHSAHELVTNSKYKDYGWASRERIDASYPKGMELTDGEMKNIRAEMTEVTSASQYMYSPEEMPAAYKHKVLAAPMRLMSWPMNYFFKYQRSAINRWITGRPLHGDGKLTLPPAWRRAHIKYLVLGGALLTSLGYSRSYMRGVLPDTLAPVPTFLMGMYDYIAADTDRQKTAAKSKMKSATDVMYPGALFFKDIDKAINEGKSILFYE